MDFRTYYILMFNSQKWLCNMMHASLCKFYNVKFAKLLLIDGPTMDVRRQVHHGVD